MDHPNSQIASFAITIIVIALVLALRWRRMGQARPLKLERLYIFPTIYAAIVAILLVERPPVSINDWVWCAGALIIGAAIGWYRGKTIAISVDPATHTLNQTASPAGFIFIAGLIVIRLALRTVLAAEAATWNISAAVIVDAFLFLALGLFAAQRLEMYLRGRKLLGAHGASST